MSKIFSIPLSFFFLLLIFNFSDCQQVVPPLPSCAKCTLNPPKSELSFCGDYIPQSGMVCIPDNHTKKDTDLQALYQSTNKFLPYESSCRDSWINYACSRAFPSCNITSSGKIEVYELCYKNCMDYTMGCWSRNGQSLSWAITSLINETKLKEFCLNEGSAGDGNTTCTTAGKLINSALSIMNYNNLFIYFITTLIIYFTL
ncbi:hypothetical protein ABK040_004096 [Willaertia magna]